MGFPTLIFVQGPTRLPKPPPGKGTVAIVDVAFASAAHFDSVTLPFIRALGERLRLWCDHHEHPLGWVCYQRDPRFVLVPNRLAHACPELITPELATRVGTPDTLLVHADFDGLLTAVKLLRQGEPPYPEADEDARAVDSPGRGHVLSKRGARLSQAIDEALCTFSGKARRDFFQSIVEGLVEESFSPSLEGLIQRSAASSRQAQIEAERVARESGTMELPGIYVVRVTGRRQGRERKTLLRIGEQRARIGVVVETEGDHAWITAATFDESLDLGDIGELMGGRSDFRGCELHGGNAPLEPILRKLSNLARDGL
ncbi:MAG: hypothetical protein LBM75_02495 [Myxococcales bacterium]|jgi:hypothetical protein|nr:hypothetical protein [Myxococcales bacterium]